MNAQQIKNFKTALRVMKTIIRPTHETATQDDWDMFNMIYDNAEDIVWKYAEAVMKSDGEWELKNLMEDWAYDCDMFWNGTKFVNFEEKEAK